MENQWRKRLTDAIERDGRTPRAISIAADLGPNFITQMVSRGTAPSTPALVSLCAALGVSLTYIFTGAEMTPGEEELLTLAADLEDDSKDLLIDLARKLQAPSQH